MRTLFVIVMAIAFILSSFSDAWATPKTEKIKRGFVNIVTAPVEVPKQVRGFWIEGSEKTYHILPWIFCGMVKGTANMFARIVSGAWDIVSFPFDGPQILDPIYGPEYVFDELPVRDEK